MREKYVKPQIRSFMVSEHETIVSSMSLAPGLALAKMLGKLNTLRRKESLCEPERKL